MNIKENFKNIIGYSIITSIVVGMIGVFMSDSLVQQYIRAWGNIAITCVIGIVIILSIKLCIVNIINQRKVYKKIFYSILICIIHYLSIYYILIEYNRISNGTWYGDGRTINDYEPVCLLIISIALIFGWMYSYDTYKKQK